LDTLEIRTVKNVYRRMKKFERLCSPDLIHLEHFLQLSED